MYIIIGTHWHSCWQAEERDKRIWFKETERLLMVARPGARALWSAVLGGPEALASAGGGPEGCGDP